MVCERVDHMRQLHVTAAAKWAELTYSRCPVDVHVPTLTTNLRRRNVLKAEHPAAQNILDAAGHILALRRLQTNNVAAVAIRHAQNGLLLERRRGSPIEEDGISGDAGADVSVHVHSLCEPHGPVRAHRHHAQIRIPLACD